MKMKYYETYFKWEQHKGHCVVHVKTTSSALKHVGLLV